MLSREAAVERMMSSEKFWLLVSVLPLNRGYNMIKHCDQTAKTVLTVLS